MKGRLLHVAAILVGVAVLGGVLHVLTAPAKASSQPPGQRPPGAVSVHRTQTTVGPRQPLAPFYSVDGQVTLSLDAAGTNDYAGRTIRVDKPDGATVRKAFLFAASTGFTEYVPTGGDVTLDGHAFSWIPGDTIWNGIDSVNVAADVTTLVKSKIDAAPAGEVDFNVNEPRNTYNMDGEILAVVFDDPSAPVTNSVTLMYGAQDTSGDSFDVSFGSPLDTSDPNLALDLSLGISYGFQPDGQYSEVDVNGNEMTSSAGGQDDGEGENGALITVGGIGDSNDNPPDPTATDDTCLSAEGDPAPRCDDELYSLLPFVSNGDTGLTIDTYNPSADDNIFFAALVAHDASAVVVRDLALGPDSGVDQAGTSHTFTATYRDQNGDPTAGQEVDFQVISGPNTGRTGSAITDANGQASFTLTSTKGGTDIVSASATDETDRVHLSNTVTETWLVSGWAPGGDPASPRSQEQADIAHINDPGECAPNSALLFRVRGTSESPGTDLLGGWTAAAGKKLIADGWRVRDMQGDYPAPSLPLSELAKALKTRNPIAFADALLKLKQYRDVVTNTWRGVAQMITAAYNRCPQRTIVLSGYSLGGIVLRYVVPNLPDAVRSQIARIDLVADPTEQGTIDGDLQHSGPASARLTDQGVDTFAAEQFNPFFKQTHYPSDVSGVTYQYCLPYDVVCDTNPLNLTIGWLNESTRHRSYAFGTIGTMAAGSVDSRRSW